MGFLHPSFTLTLSTALTHIHSYKQVEKLLGMKEPFEIILSPNKSNIILNIILYSVSEIKGEIPNHPLFLNLVEE